MRVLLLLFLSCLAAGQEMVYKVRQHAGSRDSVFGSAVNSAADGTALVSSHTYNNNEGIAYIFQSTVLNSGVSWRNATISPEDGSLVWTTNASVAIDGTMDTESVSFRSNYSVLIGATVWTQLASLTASDGASLDYFSKDSAIASEHAIITAHGKDSDTGAAYVFSGSDGSSWTEQAKLVAADGASGDNFGWSVALSTTGEVYTNSIDNAAPSFICVGAPDADTGSGAVYTFAKGYSSLGWSQQSKLQPADSTAADSFGFDIAATSDVVVIGAEGRTAGAGGVYVYTMSVAEVSGTIYQASWSQQQILEAPDQAPGDAFGTTVAISSDNTLIAVGATGEDSGGASAGAVYLFMADTPASFAWSHGAKLLPSDGQAGAYFGSALDTMSYTLESYGRDVAVGSYARDNNRGSVHIFHEYIQTEGLVTELKTWSQASVLRPYADGVSGDNFGYSLDYTEDGGNLLVSSYRSDSEGTVSVYHNADATATIRVTTEGTYVPLDYTAMAVCQAVAVLLGLYLASKVRAARQLSHKTVELLSDTTDSLAPVELLDQDSRQGRSTGSGADAVAGDGNNDGDGRSVEEEPVLSLQAQRQAQQEEGFVGARGVEDSLERGMYAGISGKTEESEYPYGNSDKSELRPPLSSPTPHQLHTGKFSGSGTNSAAGAGTDTGADTDKGALQRKIEELEAQLQPGTRKNILSFQYRDLLSEITLGILTRVVTFCTVYVLYDRGSEAVAWLVAVLLLALHYIPYLIFLVDYLYPKWLDRSIRFGVHPHLLKPMYELTTVTLLLGLFQMELLRFLPWRQSVLSIVSRGFPTYRTFQVSVYCELVLDAALFLISLLAQLSTSASSGVVTESSSSVEKEDYVVWGWIHVLHLVLLSMRVLFLAVWVVVPVWHRAVLEVDIKLADSPSAIPGSIITAEEPILDHGHNNEREGEDFQSRDSAAGAVRITRVHRGSRGSGKFSLASAAAGGHLDTVSESGEISHIDNVSEEDGGYYYERDNGAMQWRGRSTEENIEQLRQSMEASMQGGRSSPLESIDERIDSPMGVPLASGGRLATHSSGAESARAKKSKKGKGGRGGRSSSGGRSGSQLFGRESRKSDHGASSSYASPVPPLTVSTALPAADSAGSGKFSPRGSGKFSTPSSSTGAGSLSAKSQQSQSGKESVLSLSGSLKTEIMDPGETSGFSSPYLRHFHSPKGEDNKDDSDSGAGAVANTDAGEVHVHRDKIPASEAAGSAAATTGQTQPVPVRMASRTRGTPLAAGARASPAKPPKPQRLLSQSHRRALLEARREAEDEGKEEEEEEESSEARAWEGEEEGHVRNYDSLKSNVSDFPAAAMASSHHHAAEQAHRALDARQESARKQRGTLQEQEQLAVTRPAPALMAEDVSESSASRAKQYGGEGHRGRDRGRDKDRGLDHTDREKSQRDDDDARSASTTRSARSAEIKRRRAKARAKREAQLSRSSSGHVDPQGALSEGEGEGEAEADHDSESIGAKLKRSKSAIMGDGPEGSVPLGVDIKEGDKAADAVTATSTAMSSVSRLPPIRGTGDRRSRWSRDADGGDTDDMHGRKEGGKRGMWKSSVLNLSSESSDNHGSNSSSSDSEVLAIKVRTGGSRAGRGRTKLL